MYDRDGTARPSWFDPLGFAGLADVTPPPAEVEVVQAELDDLGRREVELDREITEGVEALRKAGGRFDSMRRSPHLAAASARLVTETEQRSADVTALRRERSENAAVAEGLQRRLTALERGERGDPRAHIRHAAIPVPEAKMRFDQAAEVWAAVSISLLLVGLALLLVLSPGNAWGEAIVLVLAAIVGESVLRGTFTRTINRIGVVLALIALVVLLVQYAKAVLIALLVTLAAFLLYQRVQEYRA
jgi:hypothetical protein